MNIHHITFYNKPAIPLYDRTTPRPISTIVIITPVFIEKGMQKGRQILFPINTLFILMNIHHITFYNKPAIPLYDRTTPRPISTIVIITPVFIEKGMQKGRQILYVKSLGYFHPKSL